MAAQKAPTPRATSVAARRSTQAFHRIRTQAVIDISSSSTLTPRPTASACAQK
jgi:hypothetical protein